MRPPIADERPTGPGLGHGELAFRLDVRRYALLFGRSWILLTVAGLLGLGLAMLYGLLQTPVYRATVILQMEPPTPLFMNVTDALMGAGSYWENEEFYNTQFKILKSNDLGDKVVAGLKLKDKAEFKNSDDPGAAFMGHVEVYPVPKSRLVNVSIFHTDPREAAEWANALADIFIKVSVSNRMEQAAHAMEWLAQQVKTTQVSMQSAQTELLQGMQQQDLVVSEGSQSVGSASLEKLNTEYLQAKTRRIEIEAALKQVRDFRARDQSLESVPQVATDAQIVGLNNLVSSLESQLSTLRGRYREGHPEVRKLQAQTDQARKARTERASAVASGLETECAQLQKREAELQVAIVGQRAQAVDQSRKVAEIETLRKRTDSSKNLYDVLLQKLNETNIAASMRNNGASVVERARPPRAPVRPDKRRLAAIGLLLGLAAAGGLVLVRDTYFDDAFRDPEDVERFLDTDLLAAIPKGGDARVVMEAYQNLRTALLFARKGEEGQVVLITSTAPEEGKTTTVVNLGELLAASGDKTVLVDCDLRRAQVDKRLGLPREPGFTSYFTHQLDAESLVQPCGTGLLFAMTAGPMPENPPSILARAQLQALFAELRQHYRWILIDSPPLASVTDALLLARHADMVVAVVRYNGVDKRLVKRAVAALRRTNPTFLGVVLNLVEMKAGSYYNYYYQHYYQHHQRRALAASSDRAT